MLGNLAGNLAGTLPPWLLTALLLAIAAGIVYVALLLPHRHKAAAIGAVL